MDRWEEGDRQACGGRASHDVCKRILLSRNVCVLTKIIRGKFRSCGFGSNFCPVEVAQWSKASVQVMDPARREQ